MAAIDLDALVSVPGRICVGPTDLSAAFPHGGTAWGATRGVVLLPQIRHGEVPYDALGGEPGEVIYLGASWRLAAVVRGLDADVVAGLFPNVVAGPATKQTGQTIDHPGTVRAGAKRSGSAVKLLFSPDDPTHLGVLLHRAVPVVDPAAAVALRHGASIEVPMAFVALRRSSDARAVQVGRLELLTL